MKRLFITLFLFVTFYANSQTTITASYVTNNVVFSTGLTYITFAIRNTNSFPVTLTDMTCMEANLYDNNVFSLWYSPTSLSGGPTVTSPVWTQVTTSLQPITTSVITQVTPFNCIGLTIPPLTTYRFALQSTKGTAVRAGVTPNIFSSGGVDLLVGDNISTGGQVGYFGWQVLGNAGAPYFFDGSITFAPIGAYTDIQVLKISKPTSVCSATSNVVMAQVCNKSPHTINFTSTPTNINFNISGPISQTATVPLNSGTLAPCGCVNATLGGVNFSASGNYTITATAAITGVIDANPINNTAIDSLINYKPILNTLMDSVCQFTSGPLFQGFTGSNCQLKKGSYTVNCLVATTPPPDGNSDATATQFAQSSLPGLPAGAVITGGKLFLSNLNCVPTGSLGNETRFSIYSPLVGVGAPFVPGVVGSPLNFSIYNFDYAVQVTATQLNAMYAGIGAGGTFSIGYWETVDNAIGQSDISINAQNLPTQAQLTIEYTILPQVKWFTTASGGSAFYNGSTMNPFTLPSGLNNTNTTGSYPFYAACSSDSVCRVPVILKINPSPVVVQDSLESCELISSTGNGSFNLNSLSGAVSAFNPLATVSFYQDPSLSLLITNPSNYIANTNYVFSKVLVGSCYSSDSIYLLVHPKPQFISALVSGAVCQPDYIDAANLIDPFSTVSAGTDTLFFSDPAYSMPHPNPHFITTSDTVYMLFVTNTIPSCQDSSEAIITIFPHTNFIVSQDTNFNFSVPGSVSCVTAFVIDGQHDTLHTTNDCSRIASVFDEPNGVSLGNTTFCEEIDSAVQFHNGQPYVNRHYQISPTINDSATICLYYLDDDLIQYNNTAFGLWPLLPTAANPSLITNLCIAQVHNGDLNTPGHTVTSIPNTSITSLYDSTTTIWTFCFHVDSFSYFYLHSQNPLNIPLPVELLSFTGKRLHNSNVLEWTSAQEINNDYFIVERSSDGHIFKPYSKNINSKVKEGSSSSKNDYSFIDTDPFDGHTFYRLLQVDIDGKRHSSKVIDLFTENECSIAIYPNPAEHEIEIDIQSTISSAAQIKIIDATGRIVRTVDLTLQVGMNKAQIDLSLLPDGIYLISVSDTKGLNYTKPFRKK